MLHIIQSNRMEILQAQLGSLIKSAPLTNPFANEVILVQSPGMSEWLKLGLSRDIGVSAQIEFPLPSSFIWRLYQTFLPDVPRESAFNKPNMTWKLFNLLPSCFSDLRYQALANYLGEDPSGIKQFALCEKIADVFDQYLMYRPHWLAQWENDQDVLDDVDVINLAPWQPDLWRKLVGYTEQLGQSAYHRANMHEQLLQALSEAKTSQLPERICIFGLSAIANSQLEIFQALAQKTNVMLFFFNPSEHYWGDIVDEKTQAKIIARYAKKPEIEAQQGEYFYVGNPLLSSWGKLGRDYFEQLLQLDASWIDGFDPNFDTCVLHQVQQEIYQLAFKGETLCADTQWFVSDEGKLPIEPSDRSISFQDCHTPLREVERLHDYLLSLFDENPSLTPKDVIVMMPDVGVYSPFIKAVFDSAESHLHIPYAISDLAIDQERPILNSFVTLVELPTNRFCVSEILDLLGVTAISQQFGIEPQDFDLIRYWLERVSVKWGINDAHKSEYGLPKISLNTWQHGLNRLLLGVATGDEQVSFADVYAADEVEGMAVALLNKLVSFFDALMTLKSALSESRDLRQYAEILKQAIATFYHPESEQSWDLLKLGHIIEGLEKHYDNQDMLAPISAKVLAYLVKQGVREKGVGQRFLAGAVNFCTLMPMRAIPFKVVCMLGLNDADYPRTVQPIGFDLVAHSIRQKGDRSRKLDDRYLFLEALLSARNFLYISYIGRSCFNNEAQVPSVLVSELVEYLERSFYIEGVPEQSVMAQLKQQLPLQPFNPAHYTSGQLQSFNSTWLWNTDHTVAEPTNALSLETQSELELTDLIRGITAPQRMYFQQVLGVKLKPIAEISVDEEPFALDPLSRYQYLDEVLLTQLGEQPLNDEQILQRGSLPQANIGKLQLTGLIQRVSPMVDVLTPILVEKKQPVEVAFTINEQRVVGWLDSLYQQRQVFYRTASIKAKDLLHGYVMHCVANIVEQHLTTEVVGLDQQVTFEPISVADAQQRLVVWLDFYQHARAQPQPFFPTSSFEYAKTQDFNKALAKFAGGQYVGRGDGEDPYVQLCFSELSAHQQAFIELSEQLAQPILELAKERRHADA
ncbi:exodeoxyribonuclease V subunit gamma [Pseudoalteromonas sp. T1lg65]|uniref:exodeoxyribonuclease V subunit gamma n=1 Tax=Pseudoalteromonas sp. T1lg65 TaxID=2077101 RepID=UPI003F79CB6B